MSRLFTVCVCVCLLASFCQISAFCSFFVCSLACFRYGTGALATMGACVFSNPLEVIKTRMQLQVSCVCGVCVCVCVCACVCGVCVCVCVRVCVRLCGLKACSFCEPVALHDAQGELQARGTYATQYRNVFHAGYVVLRNEGIRYRAFGPWALCCRYQFCFSPTHPTHSPLMT